MLKFMHENKEENKEAILNCISSLLINKNFTGKRLFIGNLNGLQFLGCLIMDATKYSINF